VSLSLHSSGLRNSRNEAMKDPKGDKKVQMEHQAALLHQQANDMLATLSNRAVAVTAAAEAAAAAAKSVEGGDGSANSQVNDNTQASSQANSQNSQHEARRREERRMSFLARPNLALLGKKNPAIVRKSVGGGGAADLQNQAGANANVTNGGGSAGGAGAGAGVNSNTAGANTNSSSTGGVDLNTDVVTMQANNSYNNNNNNISNTQNSTTPTGGTHAPTVGNQERIYVKRGPEQTFFKQRRDHMRRTCIAQIGEDGFQQLMTAMREKEGMKEGMKQEGVNAGTNSNAGTSVTSSSAAGAGLDTKLKSFVSLAEQILYLERMVAE
jgi:hypothetical protein